MRESLLEGRGPTWNEPEAEKVYSITQVVDSQGRINYIQESGDLTDAWAKVVNPSSMAALSSGFLYHEGSFERLDEDGTTHKYHEVTRSPFVPGEVSQPQPFRFGAGIEDWITSGDGSEREVTVLLRTFEEWDIPPRPDSRVLSIADMIAHEGILSGKCIYFEIVNAQVAGTALTTNTYCYYGDQNDAWPL